MHKITTGTVIVEGYEPSSENVLKADLLKMKLSKVDVQINPNCTACGTPITSPDRDTLILNTPAARSGVDKRNRIISDRADVEWQRQLDSIKKSKENE